MLQALGLGPAEEVIYTALLARPAASQELARQTGLEQAETARILLDLETRGLVAVATEAERGASDSADCEAGLQSARYRLTPPSVALAPFLVEQRNALHQAESAFSMLVERRFPSVVATTRWRSHHAQIRAEPAAAHRAQEVLRTA
ncbi:helix-turn-helix domain-containing protein [Streptomyces sp. NPDC056291]|uniref:helix-turn-helix domain-containing protein n=1 Tax=Streptomyces sp. NPDC056291 TaxID=3345772 RepID=UPI0035DAB292